ncbi:MAG: apolipoprotein N-acyltransferase [Thermodesulfobacteriota bacterium]
MRAPIILAALSALLLGVSFAPVSISLFSWVSLVPLFWALDRVSRTSGGADLKKSFLIGWIFGFVFFLITVYWVFYSMYFHGGVPFVVSILIMLLLVSCLALYHGVFALAYVVSSSFGPVFRLFLIASAWVALEYLRGVLFTGFPWALVGYTQARSEIVIQIADLFGVFGISFLIVAVNFAVYSFFNSKTSQAKRHWAPAVVALVLLTSTLAYGFINYSSYAGRVREWKSTRVAIAQGDIEQSIKWKPENRLETIEIYSELSLRGAEDGAGLIIWPESAMPFYLAYEEESSSLVRKAARETGSYILTGSPHYEIVRPGKPIESDNTTGEGIGELDPFGSDDFFNSAFLIDRSGEFTGRYDKVKLVPFGEYVPIRKVLFFIDKLTEGFADFVSGPGHMPKDMDGTKIGVLICFESIFPGIARDSLRLGASFLVIITNDGWFGPTSAAYQHFEMAILRAVEGRVYVLRAANRGISGVIDPLGRIVAETGLFTRELITADIGLRDAQVHTFYTRYGHNFGLAAIIFFVVSFFIKTRFRR